MILLNFKNKYRIVSLNHCAFIILAIFSSFSAVPPLLE